jgi:signal peptidase I
MRRGKLLDFGLMAVVAIALAFAVQAFVVKPYRIPSESMASTLRPGDRVLVNKVVYRLREPQRGDVMVFQYPRDRSVVFIKRVVGVPGDTLQVKDGRLLLNGHPVKEPYVHRTGGSVDPTLAQHPLYGSTMQDPWSLSQPYTVPVGSFFVMGDNRTDSDDSRDWGVVPRDAVVGEGFFLYWPPDHWSGL